MTIGHEQSYYSVSQGIAPQIAYQVSPQIMVQSSLAYQRKHYLSSSDRDGHSLTFSPSVRYFLNDHSYTSLGGYVGRDASGVDIWSNHSRGINVGYFNAFAPNWNLYCSPSYSKTDYEGIETAYGVRRSDNHFEMTTNLNYRIDAWKTNVALSFTHINNASSIDMYHYQRQQTMLTLTKNF